MESNQLSDEVMTFFKTLANVERLKIVGLIAIEDLTPVQIADRLGLKPAHVLKHLEQLMQAGLVQEIAPEESREKPHAPSLPPAYRLDVGQLNDLTRRALSGSRPKVQLDDFVGEDYDRKVLADFLKPDGTLKSIPTQHKKLIAVLRYLLQEFEHGVEYTEKHVNILLAKRYPDAASLRRYLVDNNLLTRERGVYWRVDSDR